MFYPNMVKILKTEINTLNNEFYKFKNRIIQSRKNDKTYFIGQISKFEKQYKQAGLENNFAGSMFAFAEQMQTSGVKDLPGIIYSALMKMPFLKPQVKEVYAIKALEYAHEQGDIIHELARLVDLEKIYKKSNEKQKYANSLFRQEKILSKICGDFSGAKKNYRTYSRNNNTIKHYEMELAKTRVDIAKIILRTNPQQAKTLLHKARITFEKTCRTKEVNFVDLLLSEITV